MVSLQFTKMQFVYTTFILFCFSWLTPLHAESMHPDRVKDIIRHSTITRVQKPFIVRADRETLEYFIVHVEELTKHGRDFNKKELILEVMGNGRYGIQMPSRHVSGEFALVEQLPKRATYMGHGNAAVFFNFSGSIVLEIDYSTENDAGENYEAVKTAVHLKFDNAFFALIARAVSPLLNPKLDKFITRLSTKTKKVVETAYANKKAAK